MGIEDVIDRAMDAAEEKLAADAPAVEESAPVEEKEVVEPVTKEAPTEEEKPTEDEKVSGQEADEEAPEVEPKEEGEQETAPESKASPIEVPTFWPAELKAVAAEAPKEVVEKFLQFDVQRENVLRRALDESGRLRAEKQREDEIIEPHRARLAAAGIRDKQDMINRMLGWNELYATDIKGFLRKQMLDHNITPDDLYGDGGANNAPEQDPVYTQYQELQTKFDTYVQEQERAKANVILDQFKNGVDSTGAKRSQFFDMYRPQITQTMREILTTRPDLSEDVALHHAYEFTLQQARQAFGVPAQQPEAPAKPTEEQRIAQAQKMKLVTGSVKGAPSTGAGKVKPRLKGDSFEEKLNSAMDIAETRVASR